MLNKKILILLASIVTLSAGSTFAQYKTSFMAKGQSEMTGNLLTDTKIAQKLIDDVEIKTSEVPLGKKSSVLAGFMSLAIPGAGEVYAGSYWKALAFVAVEAAAISANIYYNKKGDDATKEFQVFADEHWSARRYAEWINKYAAELNVTSGVIDLDKVDAHDYTQIHAAEEMVEYGNLRFSHKLPDYHSQQYYELIGKYHQYNHGWDDSDPNTITWNTNLSERFIKYAAMHIKPDETFYKYASRATVVMVINHIISAIDAIWTTSRYNKALEVKMSMKTEDILGMTEFYPQLNVKVNL